MMLNVARRLAILLLLLVVTGCTSIPGPGPSERVINGKSADVAGFSLIDIVAENVGYYRVSRTTDQAGTAGIPPAPRISLAPGDLLKVKIAESREGGLFAPLASGGTSFDNVRVSDRGTISLPYAGQVKVQGLDTTRVEERVRARLAGVAFEPQVFVELQSGRATSVLVSGEVKTPGRFSLLDGPLTLIDGINKAGGATKPPHQLDVLIRRASKVFRVPLVKVFDGNNEELRSGDEVIVESNLKAFNALGAVKQAGQVDFKVPHPTLLDALSQVGGLDNVNSSTTGVFVFRLREPRAWQDEDGQWQEGPVIFRFNLSKPETMFLAQAFGVKPEDTVYVTNAPSIEWMRAIEPIARTLSIVKQGVDMGATVDGL
jgi:polysaccharide export outer membrane protein